MTSPEIQQAAFLDLLFENRNKLYGAYTLHKFYNQRLAMALLLSLALAAFLFIIIAQNIKNGGAAFPKKDADELMVRTRIIPEQLKPPMPPASTRPKQPSAPVAQQQLTQIRITTNQAKITDVPTQADLTGVAISNTTTPGALDQAIPNVPAIGAGAKPGTQPPSAVAPVKVEPQFPGGAAAWAAYLSRNLQAPENLEAGEKKTVLVKFLVNEDGAVTGFDVIQSGGTAFDAEVIRVLKKMPKWKPALKNGVPAAVSFTQPVTFLAMGE